MHRGIAILLLLACGCLRQRAAAPVPTAVRGTPSAADPRVRFGNAVARVERGDDGSARPIFAELLRDDPELADYDLAYLAAIDERAGRLPDAAASIDRLVEAHPASVWIPRALAQRARLAAALGDPRADDLVTRALAAPGSDTTTRAAALLVRADLRAPTEPREALELYREVRHTPGPSAATARSHSDALVLAHPELFDDPMVSLEEGTQLLHEGRLDESAVRLEAAAHALSDRDDRARALRTLAKLRQRQGRIDDAIATYHDAADAEPPPAVMARYELATLLWNRDRDPEAARALQPHRARRPPSCEGRRRALRAWRGSQNAPDTAATLRARISR